MENNLTDLANSNDERHVRRLETSGAVIALGQLSAPEVDALVDNVWDYYNKARSEWRLDAAREDLATLSQFICRDVRHE